MANDLFKYKTLDQRKFLIEISDNTHGSTISLRFYAYDVAHPNHKGVELYFGITDTLRTVWNLKNNTLLNSFLLKNGVKKIKQKIESDNLEKEVIVLNTENSRRNFQYNIINGNDIHIESAEEKFERNFLIQKDILGYLYSKTDSSATLNELINHVWCDADVLAENIFFLNKQSYISSPHYTTKQIEEGNENKNLPILVSVKGKQKFEDMLREYKLKLESNRNKKKNIAGKKTRLKAFISYSVKDKEFGIKASKMLEDFEIEPFLAHENIHISEEWKERITQELGNADFFVFLLSENFKSSDWAPQESGVAYFRGKLFIPLSLDETQPFGFISHRQGKVLKNGIIPHEYLVKPIVDAFPGYMIPKIINYLGELRGFRHAEDIMRLIEPRFDKLSNDELSNLVDNSISNDQIWDAGLCRTEYLPKLIEINRNRIEQKKLKALLYQIENREPYRE